MACREILLFAFAAASLAALAEDPEVRGKWWTMNVTNTIGGVHRIR